MARKKSGEQGVTVYLAEARYTALKHFAVDEKSSLSEILGEALDAWWTNHPKRSKYEPAEPPIAPSNSTVSASTTQEKDSANSANSKPASKEVAKPDPQEPPKKGAKSK